MVVPLAGLIAGGVANDPDLAQDIESAFTGGMTSEEEKILQDRLSAINQGYGQASGYVGNQYFGPTADRAERIRELEAALNDPWLANDTSETGMRAKERAQQEIQQLKGEIYEGTGTQAGIKYTPDIYVPQKSFDIERYHPESYKAGGYTPTEFDVQGYEATEYTPEELAMQTEGMWYNLDPERFAAPEYEAAAAQESSKAARARADREGMAAQREALAGVQDIYRQGGLTAIDRARLEESRRRNQMIERASREAILADFERRGQSGSGVELAARLANQQGSSERMAQEALGIDALAQQRSERALGMAGGMGQGLAGDVFGREFATGSAADEINRFNTQGARDVQAAKRAAKDAFTAYQRDMLGRDVNRLNEQGVFNAMSQNEANQWNAAAQNAASQWGAGQQNFANQMNAAAMNTANQWNTGQQNAANQWNAGNQTAANQWNAAAQNAANQWGANALNQANMFNTVNQTAANQWNAQNAINQLAGYNTQQSNLGNLALANQMALAGVYAQQPTADWGQFANNLWNLNQAVGGEVQKGFTYGMGGPGGAASGMMPGGGGSQGNTNPFQTG